MRLGVLIGDWIQDGRRDETMGLHLIDLNLVLGNLIDALNRQAEAGCAKSGAVCDWVSGLGVRGNQPS